MKGNLQNLVISVKSIGGDFISSPSVVVRNDQNQIMPLDNIVGNLFCYSKLDPGKYTLEISAPDYIRSVTRFGMPFC